MTWKRGSTSKRPRPNASSLAVARFLRPFKSPDDYALGEHLDRFCEAELEKFRGSGLSVPRRCDTCAFRKGTYANACVPTVMDALKCAVEGKPFLCHEHRKADEPPLRSGWLLISGGEGRTAPWPFADEVSPPP